MFGLLTVILCQDCCCTRLQCTLHILPGLQLQHAQAPAAPQAPINFFNLPPVGPGAGPRYPSMDSSAMGTHAQRETRDSNDGDIQDIKRQRRNPGDANGNAGPMGGNMPPPGFHPMPPGMFPGMPPGMGPGRPPMHHLPPGMQPPPQHVGGGPSGL